ncbi:Glutaminyl-peptide cyclotransferase protein [Dioscorea alata]|uniref:Glutaminyl-peptide cyclotransferase protein n=1 Tax=Dioscorea alata TaxID=55571 RepID=A0ACB7WV43_DIOAL|nr:Glutaminyl-peptide cyclotransferase protein [Dioscorea alata]
MALGSSKKKAKRRSSELSASMASSYPAQPKALASRSKKHSGILNATCLLPTLLALSLFLFFFVFWKNIDALESEPLFFTIDVIKEFPHDPDAFTQGLVYGGNDTLFESTGLYGRSSIRRVHLQTGEVQASHQMGKSFFGEGLTLLGERLFQVTWQTKIGFVYDRNNLSRRKKFTHQMQDGWGLATDGRVIYGSDGSSTLYQLDPHTLKVLGSATVRYKDHEVPHLNELEYINGEVWANVWMTNCIARISPKDGMVHSWILLHDLRQGLLQSGYTGIDVLNGIAWDEDSNRLFVTGKLWPKLYEVKLRPVTSPLDGSIQKLCPLQS